MSVTLPGPSVGTVLASKYKLAREIGRGGMATIFAAENVVIGKPVAVKILAEELTHSKTVNERFLREARAAAKIHSPYICEVYDVGTYESRPFIVMELLTGESLYDRLARARQLDRQETFRIAHQVAKGLSKAHAENIVHRDLKPENIFLTTGADGEPVTKVVDFGLAKFYEPNQDAASARLTKEGALFGTPAYMSPEQAAGRGSVDLRSDLWSLGCIVFEMLTGRTVWNVNQGVPMILAQIGGTSLPEPRRYRPDLPLVFDAWFQKALARDPAHRFQTTSEFIVQLRQALALDSSDSLISYPHQSSPDTAIPTPFATPRKSPLPPPPGALEPPTPSSASTGSHHVGLWLVGGFVLFAGVFVGWWSGALAPLLGLGTSATPVETAPFAEKLNQAQQQLNEGAPSMALQTLRTAFEDSQEKAARSLLAHVSTALDPETAGKCKLRAVGHPRPFDSQTESSKPSIANIDSGLLVAWADNESDPARTQVKTTRLDTALRRISLELNVTPEATHAREPILFPTESGFGLLYWDFAEPRAGVYVRRLSQDGHVASEPILLSSQHPTHPYYPTITPAQDGSYWVVWVEPTRDRVHDLVVRRLGPNLEPSTPVKSLTGYPTPTSTKTQAARPSLGMLGGLLHVAFTLRRANTQEILLLRVPPAVIESEQEALPAAATARPSPTDEEQDRFLGQVLTLSNEPGKHDWPDLECGGSHCLVAWDEAQGAAFLAQLSSAGDVVWRRQLARQGTHPGIGISDEHTIAAWFDGQRVVTAPLDNGNPINVSAVGKVSAALQQPAPTVSAAGRPGQWYLGWRGYEAAVPEPFVAHIDCK